jgi:Zn-dependent protease
VKFTLLGIPVHVQPIFWLVAVVLGLPNGTGRSELAKLAIWIAVVFVSILVHELGHAMAMRAFGREARIELWGLGGLTHWGPGPPVTPGRNIAVSLSGPGAGLLLGAVVFAAQSMVNPTPGSLAADAVYQALWVNVIWGVANLIPILPLDGGHVAEALGGWIAKERGRRVAHGISLVLAIVVGAVALYARAYWIGFIAFWCVSISWRAWTPRAETAPAEAEVDPEVDAGLKQVWQHLITGQVDDALQLANELLSRVRPEDNVTRAVVLETLAWVHIEEGDEAAALGVRDRMSGAPSSLLHARLLVAEGRVDEGVSGLKDAFEQQESEFPALVLSSVYMQRDQPEHVVEMLRSERGTKLSDQTHVTLGAQLFYAQHFEQGVEAMSLAFERFGTGVHAYNAACCHARLGRVGEGLSWLEKAVGAGFDDVRQLDEDDDISALRDDPRFSNLRATVGSPR